MTQNEDTQLFARFEMTKDAPLLALKQQIEHIITETTGRGEDPRGLRLRSIKPEFREREPIYVWLFSTQPLAGARQKAVGE